MQKATGHKVGDSITLSIESTKEWPEPNIPEDINKALKTNSTTQMLWEDITPMARWDWLRWIGDTKQPETRRRRIEVMCSKLNAGDRRPCCFNRTVCTDPSVSKNGVLLEISKG